MYLYCKEDIWVLSLSEPVEEEWEVVVVVQGFQGDLPSDPVSAAVVLEGDGEVSAVVALPEGGPGRGPRLVSLAGGGRGHCCVPLPRGDGEGGHQAVVVPVIRRELP